MNLKDTVTKNNLFLVKLVGGAVDMYNWVEIVFVT